MKKLIIEEQDSGSGVGCYNGKTIYYSYDTEYDLKLAVEALIEIGFIDPDCVEFYHEYDKPVILAYEQLINKDK